MREPDALFPHADAVVIAARLAFVGNAEFVAQRAGAEGVALVVDIRRAWQLPYVAQCVLASFYALRAQASRVVRQSVVSATVQAVSSRAVFALDRNEDVKWALGHAVVWAP